MAYWDTSCVVKLYVQEPDSNTIRRFASRGGTILTSSIARLEFWSTVRRKEASGALRPGGALRALAAFDADVAARSIFLHDLGGSVASNFVFMVDQLLAAPTPILLRTLDAIHLATARAAGEQEMVSTDARLRDAAHGSGFSVYP